ncbi:hypothetical protein FHY11_000326 [Xanthomonas arboricola]|uniref:hypothetical protein n=1 Tax=Xanthomonas euroxanthea TaxID=2259622 RepID=UPI00141AE335|nr:hypothetical protein [Xanthomonas euroxanthea]NIK06860.1 hypothetical protein [Xanthomonas euroxanthea]
MINDLGVNTGMARSYAELFLIPEIFEQEDSFSWGSIWSGIKEASYLNGGKVLMNGFSFNFTKSKLGNNYLLEA